MNFITPAASVLREYFQEPQTNLRMLLTRFLRELSRQRQECADAHGLRGGAQGHRPGARHRPVSEKQERRRRPLPTHVLLKIAVFLLLYSDSYPEYAVVNEAVNAAANKEKPFVNAVLRQLLRRKQEIRELLGPQRTIPA